MNELYQEIERERVANIRPIGLNFLLYDYGYTPKEEEKIDHKKRILKLINEGKNHREVARIVGYSVSHVFRVMREYRQNGDFKPHKRAKMTEELHNMVENLILKGVARAEIEEKLSLSKSTVNKVKRELNAVYDFSWIERSRHISKETEDKCRAMLRAGHTYMYIRNELGISDGTICNIKKRRYNH